MQSNIGRGCRRNATREKYEEEPSNVDRCNESKNDRISDTSLVGHVDVVDKTKNDSVLGPHASDSQLNDLPVDRKERSRGTHHHKSPKDQLRNNFDTHVKKLAAEVEWLGSRSHLSSREAEEYQEKSNLLLEIATPTSTTSTRYELPSHSVDSEQFINRKRKLELLRTLTSTDNPLTEKKSRNDNQWEVDQLRKAQHLTQSSEDYQASDEQHYDFVFDESQFLEFSEETAVPIEGEGGNEMKPPSRFREIQEVRKSLPAFLHRSLFLEAIDKSQVLIVVGETGSGKTTQLPQYLYEAGYCEPKTNDNRLLKIGCTQPRRVAATSVAQRVADEVGCRLGQEVGYTIRFEDVTSRGTSIKYLTDGMLMREFLTDPLLSSYSVLMIDEAHERTVSTEIILTLLKDVIKIRSDLKVIVASATINAQKFADYFDGAPVFSIPGRRFPVDICYTKNPEANYLQAAITTVFQVHTKHETPGDILVFLSGQEEIETMAETLNEACDKLGDLIKPMIVAPIYANLPPVQQARIFDPTPPNSRKVVLATNIAETSITIDGIKYVIDPGYVKENVFNPATGMESLVMVPCSRASADQRAGRAGRVGPGKCYRLYTKWSFNNELQANPTPEILRVNLCGVVLLLLSMGINDLMNFDFMDPPSKETLMKALESLYALGAMNSKGQLTTTGHKMVKFPIDPMFCKALLTSSDYGVLSEVLSIVSMLSESSSLFYRPKDKRELADKRKESFSHPTGDHLTLLNIWKQWSDSGFSNLWCEDNFLQYRTLKRAREVRMQLERLSVKVGIEFLAPSLTQFDEEKVQKALLSGFFPNLARLSNLGNSFVLLKKKQLVFIHPSSSLSQVRPPPRLVMYHELVLTSKEYMRSCMRIEEKWVDEVASHYYSTKDFEEISRKK